VHFLFGYRTLRKNRTVHDNIPVEPLSLQEPFSDFSGEKVNADTVTPAELPIQVGDNSTLTMTTNTTLSSVMTFATSTTLARLVTLSASNSILFEDLRSKSSVFFKRCLQAIEFYHQTQQVQEIGANIITKHLRKLYGNKAIKTSGGDLDALAIPQSIRERIASDAIMHYREWKSIHIRRSHEGVELIHPKDWTLDYVHLADTSWGRMENSTLLFYVPKDWAEMEYHSIFQAHHAYLSLRMENTYFKCHQIIQKNTLQIIILYRLHLPLLGDSKLTDHLY
jgi:hypothetical protein